MMLGKNKMITPEEQVRMDKARMDKTQQIQRFADAKTEQIIKTSAFNGAVDLISAGFSATGEKSEAMMEEINTLADMLEAELRQRVLGGGIPF